MVVFYYLQLILEDSERIRHNLQNFRSLLDEISAVCDTSTPVERLDQTDQNVQKMQRSVLEPLEKLLQAVAVRVTAVIMAIYRQRRKARMD